MGISQVRFDFFAYSVRMFRNRKSIGIPVCFSKLAARFHHICRKRQQILQSRAGPISDSSKTQPVFWWFCRNPNKFPVQYLHYPTDMVQYHWSVFTENMRKEERRYMKKERQNTDQEALFEAILTLRSPEECYGWQKCCTRVTYFMRSSKRPAQAPPPSAVSTVPSRTAVTAIRSSSTEPKKQKKNNGYVRVRHGTVIR